MRRGRRKGEKQNASAREDHGSGEKEKIPTYRRRGRPQKPMKDDYKEEEEEEEEEDEIIERTDDEDEEEETDDGAVTSKDLKKEKKQKISNGMNTDENGLGSKLRTDDSIISTSNGFRQKGSRRKNKPRRAAEAVVEWDGV